ncbi:VOC family protein [Actinomycetospora straminea]|uniref:VOC family protein n=1 Tax=Actinomycetospora straminea TaxID=663607 RepID=A0ABP9DZY1_9PSEU|nr:VOC family protein [Actinomycetospora straminea]MDD7932456.1 VOC family protein [Actinomycetospora straminea]
MALGVQITFDAHDPRRQAEFWALALDYVRQPPPPGFDTWEDFAAKIGMPEDQWDRLDAVIDPDGAGPRLLFQKVPEDKTVKNRVHLDVNVGEGADDRKAAARAHREKLEAAGARFLREVDEPAGWCFVMADPEGNEFCLQ